MALRLRWSVGLKQLLRRRFAFGGMCPPDTFGSRHRGGCFDRASEAIRIEGAISDHQGALGNSLDQRLAAAEVGCVATGEMERDRLAGLVCRGVDLGGPAAARAPDGLRVLPPFPPEALRCAFA